MSDEAENIVQELAESDPCTYNDESMWHSCAFCYAALPLEATDHKSDCIWRRAVEHVERRKALELLSERLSG